VLSHCDHTKNFARIENAHALCLGQYTRGECLFNRKRDHLNLRPG
jgi:hypothetical protein